MLHFYGQQLKLFTVNNQAIEFDKVITINSQINQPLIFMLILMKLS